MALLLYLLGGAHSQPAASMASRRTHERKRLQKSPPGRNSRRNPYSCTEILDVVRAQSCLAIVDEYENGDGLTATHEDENSTKINPHVGFLIDENHSNSSSDSLSMYSAVEMHDDPDDQPRRRLRAKTPVYAIGQLERNSLIRECDRAMDLAEEYQLALPPRVFTPFCEAEIPKHPPKRLRKIKCQLSLRDLVKDECRPVTRHSTAYSDNDTLVGSESPRSLPSPTDEKERVQMAGSLSIRHVTQRYEQVVAELDHNIGLKICADLLTNELASALYCHHPAEVEERASGLQILMMIEAYETVQQRVRERLYDTHVTGGDEKHVKVVDEILEHWLQVLYSVYDLSQEKESVAMLAIDGESRMPRIAELTPNDEG